MIRIEHLLSLMHCETEAAWCRGVFALARDQGFDQTLYGVVPDKQTPLEHAFLRSNYSDQWRNTYDAEKMHYIDPTVGHCLGSSVPLIWEPRTFKSIEEKHFYEEACGYGIRAGITYPVHGAGGEFGVFSFVSDACSNKKFLRELNHFMPDLALIRDYVFESSLKFLRPADKEEAPVRLTPRELECLKWAMVGKSSWDISRIMCCSEATVNFHMANARRKFKVTTRQQAVIKAIRLGFISPD